MRKRDGKGLRIKVMRSITWWRFANENIIRKIKEVVSDFIEKHNLEIEQRVERVGRLKVERRDE